MRAHTQLFGSSPSASPRFLLLFLAVFLLVPVRMVSAQYMYLDSNGDGIHTDADRLNADGPTHVDVWIDIAHDRDGTPVSCNSHTGPPLSEDLDMFSYTFLLEVENRSTASLTWGTYADNVGFTKDFETLSEPFFLAITRANPVVGVGLPPGKYKLGSVDVGVASGAPTLKISPFVAGSSAPIIDNLTSFGTHCEATFNSNTYTLGIDWFDTDGLGPPSAAVASARAFFVKPDDTFRLGSAKPDLCVQIEPVGASYDNAGVQLNTITMTSLGTGTVDQVPALESKVGADRDRNGVQEITACFARADLENLFANVSGRQNVPVTLQGSLASGGTFRGTATLSVVGKNSALRVAVSPNPLNPEATMRFVTEHPGPLRVRIFDIAGRLVRELVNEAQSPAGEHSVRINGRNGDGSTIPSGIYLYRIDTLEDAVNGRFAILK